MKTNFMSRFVSVYVCVVLCLRQAGVCRDLRRVICKLLSTKGASYSLFAAESCDLADERTKQMWRLKRNLYRRYQKCMRTIEFSVEPAPYPEDRELRMFRVQCKPQKYGGLELRWLWLYPG